MVDLEITGGKISKIERFLLLRHKSERVSEGRSIKKGGGQMEEVAEGGCQEGT